MCFFVSGLNAFNGADNVYIPDSKLHLQKSYQISKNDIYSTDIFPQIDKRFKIAKFPTERGYKTYFYALWL